MLFSFFRKKTIVKNSIDNDSELHYSEAVQIIKEAFEKKSTYHYYFKQYQYYDPHGYWGITFSYKNIKIFLGSERSFIDYRLTIDDADIYLGNLDKRVLRMKRTSQKNFLILLDIMIEYINQKINFTE